MKCINTEEYKKYYFKIVKAYNNIDEKVHVFDGTTGLYYYINNVDKDFKKSLKIYVTNIKCGKRRILTFPLDNNLLIVNPVYNP